MIIGLTGSYCAGKDTVAEHLIAKGFAHFSLSDIIREEMKAAGVETSRENLITFGTNLREKFGNGYLARKALAKCKAGMDCVITSIRHCEEVETLKKRMDFTLVNVDAPIKIRFERMLGRKRPGDPKTLKEFIASEKKESQVRGSGQQLSLCARMAGRTIINAGAVKNVYKAIDVMTKELRKKMPPAYHRPNWDEYFMEICKVVGKRGTCDRGRAGAVIVKDKRIIATGYVGSPAGLAHCDEVGHLMHDVTNPDGKVSRHCIRTAHAEQNAIVQAALHGVSTNGATIYIKFEPCLVCTKMIINAGIRRVVAEKRYHAAALSRQFLQEAGVELDVLHDELEQYPDQVSTNARALWRPEGATATKSPKLMAGG